MSKEETYWYERGYNDQQWGYPLLDHVWEKRTWFRRNPKYPKKYQEIYREGQVAAWNDGARDKPWFI